MTGLEVAAVAVAVIVGATLQRLSGMGVGLIVAPVLAVVLGPAPGVLVTNATTVCSGALIMLTVLPRVDWRRLALFLPGIVLGAIPAAFVVRALDPAWLNLVIGASVLLALALTFASPRVPHVTTPWLAPAAGAVGGFLNTASGVGGPAMVIYARFARWPQPSFAATMQPTFLSMGICSVAAKLAVGATALDALPPLWLAPVIVAAVVVGILCGRILSARVPADGARIVAIVLAGLGAAVALVRGILML